MSFPSIMLRMSDLTVLPVRRQALKAETEPGAQRGLAKMAGHGQRRIAELLPSVLLAKKLLGEVLLQPEPSS